ncbi:MAG TPA: hypothetical protein VNA04_13760 [Thermoanaerobaculia bacterium]|nr:hypothetical protein [Thermoanaerobaculia bacterium]
MLERRFLAAAMLPLLVGCAADRGGTDPNPHSITTTESARSAADPFALGTLLTAEGAVARDAAGDRFRRGGELFLSIHLAGASGDHAIEVQWVDPAGRLLRRDAVEVPKDSQYAAFSSGDTAKWSPGPHRAVVTINGRRVSEREFELM